MEEEVCECEEKRKRDMKEVMVRKQGTTSPCAACKFLRRRCVQDCVFAPYFPADEPQKFANVHRVFGASNVNKMLQELPVQHRSDAVSSMVYEANARVRDPIYGCVGAISSMQHEIELLQTQLAIARAEVVRLQLKQAAYINAMAFAKPGTHLGTSPPSSFQLPSPRLIDACAKSFVAFETPASTVTEETATLEEVMW